MKHNISFREDLRLVADTRSQTAGQTDIRGTQCDISNVITFVRMQFGVSKQTLELMTCKLAQS